MRKLPTRIVWLDGRDHSTPKSNTPSVHEPESAPKIIVHKEPTLWEMEQNFEAHVEQIVRGYVKNRELLVSKEQFLTRLNEGCRKCPQKLWNEDARLGLGKCMHKDCGCSKFKLWFKVLKCPIGAWPNE